VCCPCVLSRCAVNVFFSPFFFFDYFWNLFYKKNLLQANSVNKILSEVSVYLGVCFLYTSGDLKTVIWCTRNILLLIKALLPLQAVHFSVRCLLN